MMQADDATIPHARTNRAVSLRALTRPHGVSARPWAILSAALAVAVIATLLALWSLLSVPRLGLALAPAASGDRVAILSADPHGPGAAVPAGSLLSLQGRTGERIALDVIDVQEEPDVFESYAVLAQFYARQDTLLAALRDGPLRLEVALPQGGAWQGEVAPASASALALPPGFWIQVLVGVASLLIGAWIWSLRRGEIGATLYAATGVAIFCFTLPAAVYSSRELALDATLIRILSAINHAGAMAFGVIMMAFFLNYPVRTVPAWVNRLLFLVAAAWVCLDVFWLLPAPVFGIHLATTIEMVLILACALWQWRATRGDPRARTILAWLGVSVLVGAGGFIATVATPLLFGLPMIVSQGYAFLFFLLIYAGLGVGVAHYRLFDLGQWSFRILFYVTGVALLLMLDAALILWWSLDRAPAFGLSLLAVALVYLPLRDGLARRFARGAQIDTSVLFQAGIETAFAPPGPLRDQRWRSLLERLFDPLASGPADAEPLAPSIRQEGVELIVPAVAGLPAFSVRYPWRGRGLFGPPHLETVRQLLNLLRQAEAGRNAYERGVQEERRRIAADLHDDVGARLLDSLHQADADAIKRTVREAMADIRTIAAGLAGNRLPVETVLADLRYETGQRLEQAGIALCWAQSDDCGNLVLDYPQAKQLVSCLREIASNAMRHSGASSLNIDVRLRDAQLCLACRDDGKGFDLGEIGGGGNGVVNIRRRAVQAGGVAVFDSQPGAGTRVTVTLPCRRPGA